MRQLDLEDQRYLIEHAQELHTTQTELESMDIRTLRSYLLDCVASYGNDGFDLNNLGYRVEAICDRLYQLI